MGSSSRGPGKCSRHPITWLVTQFVIQSPEETTALRIITEELWFVIRYPISTEDGPLTINYPAVSYARVLQGVVLQFL